MSRNIAIILAGGKGVRLDSRIRKQYLEVKGKPLIAWPLETFDKVQAIQSIILIVPRDDINLAGEIINKHDIKKIESVIAGGMTRQESAYNGLRTFQFHDDDNVLIHDAARPFVSKDIIHKCIEALEQNEAAGTYIGAIDTIAEASEGFITAIPPRENFYYTQTPQCFKYHVIRRSHELAMEKQNYNATDDIQLVLNAGYKVKIVEGSYINIKITTPADLATAEAFANNELLHR